MRKSIKPVKDIRATDDGKLVIPVFDERGEPMFLQFITADGGKRFLTGGQIQGGLFPILGDDGPLFIVEGFATGATIHAATGKTILVAFNAGNLLSVAKLARHRYLDRQIVICADDDHETAAREGKNPGIEKATEAARQTKALLAVPKFADPAGKSDFNDLETAEGIEAVQAILKAVLAEAAATDQEEPLDHGDAILIREGALADAVDACEAILARPDLADSRPRVPACRPTGPGGRSPGPWPYRWRHPPSGSRGHPVGGEALPVDGPVPAWPLQEI